MTRILAHTLGEYFKSFSEVNQKFQRFLMFFSIRRHTKGNHAAGKNRARIGPYPVVQTLYIGTLSHSKDGRDAIG